MKLASPRRVAWIALGAAFLSAFIPALLRRLTNDAFQGYEPSHSLLESVARAIRSLCVDHSWLVTLTLMVVGLRWLRGSRWRDLPRELRLDAPVRRAPLFALLCTVPVWLFLCAILVLTPTGISVEPAGFLRLDSLEWLVAAPFVEEVFLVGFLFTQLRRRAGWRFLPAVLLPGLVLQLGAYAATGVGFSSLEFLGAQALAILLFLASLVWGAWVFTVWGDTPWPLVFIAAFQALGASAIEWTWEYDVGWVKAHTIVRVAVLVLAALLTWHLKRTGRLPIAPRARGVPEPLPTILPENA